MEVRCWSAMRAIRCLAVVSLLVTFRTAGADGWRVRVGGAVRGGMDLNVDGSSHVQAMGLSAVSSSGGAPGMGNGLGGPGADDITAFADRDFDDGFVYRDPSTVGFGGDTWYWGYNDESQYDADVGVLTFHSTGRSLIDVDWTRTVTQIVRDEPVSLSDTLNGAGVTLEASRVLREADGTTIELATGVVALWDMTSRLMTSTFEQRVTVQRWRTSYAAGTFSTYTYDTGGVVPPAAPYEGTYDGPGPLIPNRPASVNTMSSSSSSSRLVSSTSYTARNEIAFDVDVELYEFWIGSRIGLRRGRLAVFILPKASLNLVYANVDRMEEWVALYSNGNRVPLALWQDNASGSRWLLGMGMHVGCEWDLTDSWLVALSGGYDWVPEAYELDIGPNRLSLDVSGYSMNGVLGRRF